VAEGDGYEDREDDGAAGADRGGEVEPLQEGVAGYVNQLRTELTRY
jgi:hypothetical protein